MAAIQFKGRVHKSALQTVKILINY